MEGNGFARYWSEEKGHLYLDRKLDVTKVPISEAISVSDRDGKPTIVYRFAKNQGFVSTLSLETADSPHGRLILTEEGVDITHLCSLDSRYFLAATVKGEVLLYDMDEGDIVYRLQKSVFLSNLPLGKNWKQEAERRRLEIEGLQSFGNAATQGRFLARCKEEAGFL